MYILPMTEHERLGDSSLDLTNFETKEEDKDPKNTETPFNASAAVRKGITTLKYVGPVTAERLLLRGFDSIEKIAHSTVAQVSEVEGIGEKSAQKIIEAAKAYSNLKTLNEYSTVDHSELPHYEDKIAEYDEQEKNYENKAEDLEYDIEPVDDMKEFEPWFDDKYKMSRLGKSYPPPNRVSSTIEPVVPTTVHEESRSHEVIEEDNLTKGQETIRELVGIHSEKIKANERQELLTRVQSELKSLEYQILPKSGTLFTAVDVIAVKQLKVSEILGLLLILPIKLSSFTGTLKISQNHIDYKGNVKNDELSIKKVLTTYLTKLSTIRQVIVKDLMNSGQFSWMLQQFLKLDISVEKSVIFKKVLFRNGPLQYKILLEPLLVCPSTVGFLDKVIPFAYHKSSNIHIIGISQLSQLFEFLERKYSLIEDFSDKEDLAVEYDNARDDFIEKIRFFSIPIFCFGFVSLLVMLFQGFFLLEFIKTLGYCIISVYLGVITLIYIRYLRIKSTLFEKASLPYYSRTLDDSTLILISEQLSTELMAQFSYECVDATVETQVISQLEEAHAEDLYTKSKIREVVHNDKFFEGQSAKKEKIIRKYSSFLEE